MYLGNLYKDYPELYDLLYQRYLKSIPDFVDLVSKNTPKGGRILDLAAGTGEVSIPLLKSGFKVTSLDRSKGMLKQLKLKATNCGIKNHKTVIQDMQKLAYREKFDSICIRQAINYYLNFKALTLGFKKIRDCLKPGGNFIFNAPNYKGEKEYPTVSNLYESGNLKAFVVETNKIRNGLLRHMQYSIVWEGKLEPKFVTDENSFYMFTKEEFEKALKNSGFSKIEFSGTDKTLYCVATK